MKDLGRQTWVLKEFLRHCHEAKNAEYHAVDYVVMSRKRYEQLVPPNGSKIPKVWIDEAQSSLGK